MDIISPDAKGNKNVNGAQVLNKIISLNHRPITILVPNEHIKREPTATPTSSQKIPRPANAFMIFANENRKKVAKEFPQESNKEISCRLGMQWKNLSSKEKEKYFSMAKLLDADHKRKYPDYVYNPKEARIRKAMRERERSMGAAQMGGARSRRPNWPKPPVPVHMQGPGPASHPDHLLGTPSKELCSALRAEMEHGFLTGNGGYVYPSQQYQFSPQTDYATYIQVTPGLSNWVQNQYNMQQQGNALAQQQIWNQYQTERLRVQQTAGPSYLLNPQGQTPDYQHIDHMPPNNMMQMGPTPKPTIHQNLENAANDVERYMNIPSTMTSNATTNTVESRTQIPESLQTIDNSAVTTRSVANSTPSAAAAEPADVANGNMADVNDMVSGMQENNTPPELNISNVTAMSEVDAQINNMETTGNSPDSSFGGIGLYDDTNMSSISKKPKLAKSEAIPTAHSGFRKSEIGEPLQPYFPIDFIQGRPPFLSSNNYLMDHFIPELSNHYQEPPNILINKPEFPVDFSAQKYYESVANGNFDGPLIPGEHFGNYICDDGYGFLAFPNPQEMSNPCTFSQTSQFEVNQFLTDPNETRLLGNENNLILDLSKMPQNEEQYDVCVEKNTSEKLAEVSNKICDELSKITQ